MLTEHQERYCPENVKQEDKVAATGVFKVPSADPKYRLKNEHREVIGRILKMVDKGPPQNLLLEGPSGTGKSVLARVIAEMRGSPLHEQPAYQQRSADEWFGREQISPERGTFYVPSIFVRALETPGMTVHLQDMLLQQNRGVQNGLNDILDPDKREAEVEAMMHTLGRPVRVADRVLIIATWNTGSEYTGNIKVSANILDRFPNRIRLDYPTTEAQVDILVDKTGIGINDAVRLVKVGDQLRNLDEPITVSMRGLLQAAQCLMMGANFRDAVYFTIISGLPDQSRQAALPAMEGHYSMKEKEEIDAKVRDQSYMTWGDIKAEMKANAHVKA